jgi:hypothetical protein
MQYPKAYLLSVRTFDDEHVFDGTEFRVVIAMDDLDIEDDYPEYTILGCVNVNRIGATFSWKDK